MDDHTSWLNFKEQLQAHYEKLEHYHRELGGDYEQSSTSLMSVLQAALEASLEATKMECQRVREDCESMLLDMARIRTAMGDQSRIGADDPFGSSTAISRVKAPLLDSQKVLRIEHTAARRAFQERAIKVTALYDRLRTYLTLLTEDVIAVEIPHIDEEHPPEDVSLAKLGQLDAACARCEQELNQRRKHAQVLGREIIQLWAELAVQTSELDSMLDRAIILDSQKNPDALGLSDANLAELEDKRQALVEEKAKRERQIGEMMTTIKNLHLKLRQPRGDIAIFLSRNRGVAQPVITSCEVELQRLLELKKDHIEDFVKDSREILNSLWDKLYYNEDQRLDFTPAFTDIYTDSALQAHENEIERLEALVKELEPMLLLVSKHVDLMLEKCDLDVQTADPSRFSRRGYNPMAESKLRARIENALPRVESNLREALSAWEEEHGTPFKVWGEAYSCGQSQERKPISRLETAPVRGDNLASSLTRSQNGDVFKKARPRTPRVVSRPATAAATPSRTIPGSHRSTSTPMRSHNTTDHVPSRSPSKRSVSQQSRGQPSSALRERSDSNTKVSTRPKTGLPQKATQRRIISPKPATSAITKLCPGSDNGPLQRSSVQTATAQRTAMAPPKMQSATSSSRGLPSGSSTSSQVSTENWEAVQHSSEGEEEEALHQSEAVRMFSKQQMESILSQKHFDPCSSTHDAVTGPGDAALGEVPEETSFDSWGGEGF